MKIVCTVGFLLTWVVVAFLLGVAAGVRIAAVEAPAPASRVAIRAIDHSPLTGSVPLVAWGPTGILRSG